MFSTIRWRIAIPYALLALISIGILGLFLSQSAHAARLASLQSRLIVEARLIADASAPLLARNETSSALEDLAKRWAALSNTQVTLIRADGRVLGDSYAEPETGDNLMNFPEVQQALAAGQGSSVRLSQTARIPMVYAAVPIRDGERVLGIAHVAAPLGQFQAGVESWRQTILAAMLITASAALLLALRIATKIAQPLHQLTQVARRLSEGDLSARLLPTTYDEIGQLICALNQMADRFQKEMTALVEERRKLAVVLDHMADGVLITDSNGRVRLINPAAARLFQTTETAALGRSCAQVLRHHRLIELWRACCEQGKGEQVEVVELERQGLFLRVIVTPLQQASQEGCLLVIQDLTQIRRLETVRRDFITNISHELRTPLASLKALVETLRDGALDDPPVARRFLGQIETEVDALTQMVQELLELSRIESGQVPLRLVPTLLVDVILPPVERLRPQAERAGLDIQIELPPELPPVLADAERAQQVVANLVHNAIKFTPPGGRISISAMASGDEVVIAVRDTGIGIPADDLPRIFERFYKADRARTSGGTGLGLAIAKHVVQGHGGRIWAESVEGQGSTFFFTLSTTKG
jgi:two-component system phosphate regulon sensor histidine kinase PhoR